MLTTFDDDGYIRGALEHGASGYILKDMLPINFIHAIRVVAEGEKYLSPSVVDSIVRKSRAKCLLGLRSSRIKSDEFWSSSA